MFAATFHLAFQNQQKGKTITGESKESVFNFKDLQNHFYFYQVQFQLQEYLWKTSMTKDQFSFFYWKLIPPSLNLQNNNITLHVAQCIARNSGTGKFHLQS